MDIIHIIGTNLWEWSGRYIPVECIIFVTRYDLILVYTCVYAYLTMLAFRAGYISNTFAFQVLLVVFAVILGMATPLEFITSLGATSKNILFLLALCCYSFLPYASMRFLVRRNGMLSFAVKINYCISCLLLIIQIAVSIGEACLKK